MGRVVKTISLDEMTAKMAENIPNFSAWIRQQLIIESIAQGGETLHIVEKEKRKFSMKLPTGKIDSFGRRGMKHEILDKCNPYHTNGVCHTCWPPELSIEGHLAKMVNDAILEAVEE